jgi:hypothetical protein
MPCAGWLVDDGEALHGESRSCCHRVQDVSSYSQPFDVVPSSQLVTVGLDLGETGSDLSVISLPFRRGCWLVGMSMDTGAEVPKGGPHI